jgi:hypothetical protein
VVIQVLIWGCDSSVLMDEKYYESCNRSILHLSPFDLNLLVTDCDCGPVVI